MEFGKKSNKQPCEDSGQKQGLLGKFKEILKKVDEDQLFFNSRFCIFELLSSIGNAQTAIVDLHFQKQGLTYELTFDAFYTKPDGKVMTNKGFHTAYLTDEGYIPTYIINEIKRTGNADVRFDTNDIESLFKERSVLVKEVISYKELVEECINEGISNIILKDRVFYTRIECYQNGTLVDAVHSASVKEMPLEINRTLYPCKVVQAVIQ